MIRASLDIGSNTVRVLVGKGFGQRMTRMAVRRRITRLGGQFDGNLNPDSMSRTLEAVKDFSTFARGKGVMEIRAGCTGVVRKAENAGEFLELLRKSSGLDPVILAGEQEARLSAMGARHHLGEDFPEFLLVDIGGFSTELVVTGWKIGRKTSFDFGVVSLTETLLRSDPPTKTQIEKMRGAVEKAIADFFKRNVPAVLVGISGTPTTIAAIDLGLEVFDPKKVHRHTISLERLGELLDKMLLMKSNRRLESFKGLEKGREDLLPAGMIIFQEIMKAGRWKTFTVSTGSLLDGILLSDQWPPPEA
jgi:exopolyphosphatase / guanosine-5'-triphosphate,3'-diphosphate pyrophosphatase